MACPDPGPVIAIVGAGFSGTLLASLLLSQAQRPLRLLLVERSGRFGPGVAYGTDDPGPLLNVSAGAISAWPEDPSHLLRWLDLSRSRESIFQLMQLQRLAPTQRITEAQPANLHLGDLQPAEQHDQERQLQSKQTQATEEANREIYNAFLGMFI